jgi:hypothetical protein
MGPNQARGISLRSLHAEPQERELRATPSLDSLGDDDATAFFAFLVGC